MVSQKNHRLLMFPGQGSQKVGMGLDLYTNFVVAKRVFEEVNDALNRDLSKIMFTGHAPELNATENTQPALFATSMAVVRVLEQELGMKISDYSLCSAGHSLGEYSALCAAGVITLHDGAKILQARANAMNDASRSEEGGMLAVIGITTLDDALTLAQDVTENTGHLCQVANDNGAQQYVLSGTSVAVTVARTLAKDRGFRAIPLRVSGAFHSEFMKPASKDMEEVLSKTNFNIPTMNVIPNFSLQASKNPEEIKKNLVQQIHSRVRWRETIEHCIKKGIIQYIELGSGSVLSALVKKISQKLDVMNVSQTSDVKVLCNAHVLENTA